MNKGIKISIIVTIILIVGFFIVKIVQFLSLPPGCIDLPFYGGCFGKNKIKNFEINPSPPSCIKITPHICTGAEIEVFNKCKDEVKINGIAAGDSYSYFTFVKNGGGNVIEYKGSPYEYPYPNQDEDIEAILQIGDKLYTLSYIRTKAYC